MLFRAWWLQLFSEVFFLSQAGITRHGLFLGAFRRDM